MSTPFCLKVNSTAPLMQWISALEGSQLRRHLLRMMAPPSQRQAPVLHAHLGPEITRVVAGQPDGRKEASLASQERNKSTAFSLQGQSSATLSAVHLASPRSRGCSQLKAELEAAGRWLSVSWGVAFQKTRQALPFEGSPLRGWSSGAACQGAWLFLPQCRHLPPTVSASLVWASGLPLVLIFPPGLLETEE